jgi:menaquinone-dependent protoporphyrinogen oxidase
MRVLVTFASRHGSTEDIARAIAAELESPQLGVEISEAGAVRSLESYDAIVLGSAVYMGSWLPDARRFVERHRQQLPGMPVWLFSSGPLGAEDPKPQGDPTGLADVMSATCALGHRIFPGRLDPGQLSLGERLITRMVRPPAGDFRDWPAIERWAREIAATLDTDRQPARAGPAAIAPR